MSLSNSTKPPITEEYQKNKAWNLEHTSFIDQGDVKQRVFRACNKVFERHRVHSTESMESAGFKYTNNRDTARCNDCELEISNWTIDMQPFAIHSQSSPTCPYVVSVSPSHKRPGNESDIPPAATSSSNNEASPNKKARTMIPHSNTCSFPFDCEIVKQARTRTFSHWPSGSSPSASQMIEAGFFACNIADRVICIYCNLICQQWTPNSDDPCEVHKLLRPKCSYVTCILNRTPTSSFPVVNEQIASSNNGQFQSKTIVRTAAYHTAFIEIPRRFASFATWSEENMPPVDDLVRAGFFYNVDKKIVTCFYCNGSLQNWGTNDNPTIEHARWFPYCSYAEQLCGSELYRKIQESKKAQRERMKGNSASDRAVTSTGGLLIPDESTLSRLVAARLDLPVSERLLACGYKLSVIKRCWEDQLRLKHDDFVSDTDLVVACMILQKQIDHIDGKKENIIVPSVALKRMREEQETAEAVSSSTTSSTEHNGTLKGSTVSPEFQRRKISEKVNINTSSTKPCVLCLKEEKGLACIPCGHLATCIPCGQSIRSCPVCRRAIDAFVRIYI